MEEWQPRAKEAQDDLERIKEELHLVDDNPPPDTHFTVGIGGLSGLRECVGGGHEVHGLVLSFLVRPRRRSACSSSL